MTLHLFLACLFLITTVTAWLYAQRERLRCVFLEKELRHLQVRHQHACHLITVQQARLAARDPGPGRDPRWHPRR